MNLTSGDSGCLEVLVGGADGFGEGPSEKRSKFVLPAACCSEATNSDIGEVMVVMNWKESYSIGIPQIDEHHQHLFYLLNEFYNNCASNAPFAELEALFENLLDYATYHFAEEERWMKESLFPGLGKQREEHRKFSKRVAGLEQDFHAGKHRILIETATFIHGWIQMHILESDAEFGRFIAASPKGEL